jgi:hypothetical protein
MRGLSASLFEWLSGWCLVLASVCSVVDMGGWAGDWWEAHQAEMRLRSFGAVGAMCRGSDVKDHDHGRVQLESLILAQNERWRQA